MHGWEKRILSGGFIFLSFLNFFNIFYFLTLQHCIGFAIYQHESTTGIHILMHELRHILGFVVIHDSRSLKQEMPESLFHIIHEIPLNLGSVFLC